MRTQALPYISSFRTRAMPSWVVEWGKDQDDETWDQMQEWTQEIWAVCCAATVTAIWLWNVSKINPDGQAETSAKRAAEQHFATLMAKMRTYGARFYPLTRKGKMKSTS